MLSDVAPDLRLDSAGGLLEVLLLLGRGFLGLLGGASEDGRLKMPTPTMLPTTNAVAPRRLRRSPEVASGDGLDGVTMGTSTWLSRTGVWLMAGASERGG